MAETRLANLTAAAIAVALGFTPAALTAGTIATALGYTPANAATSILTSGANTIDGSLTIGLNSIPLTLKSDTAGGSALFYGANNSGANITIGFNSSRGVVATPTANVSGDTLATPLLIKGHDGTNYFTAAKVMVQAATTVSTGIVPGNFLIYTANASGVLTLGFSMNHNQNVSFSASIDAGGNMTAKSGSAIGAGASSQAFVKGSSTANLGVYYGTGDPSFSAAKGSIYTKTDATTTTTRLWVNTDGSTAWTNLTTAA